MPRMTFSCACAAAAEKAAKPAATIRARIFIEPPAIEMKYCIVESMRVDHVGSLLRPESLKQAFRDHALGALDAGALREAQDRAIRQVVAKQEAIGLPVVTDGEDRRLNWQVSFSEVAGWDLWSGSWKKMLQNPGDKAPPQTPLQKSDHPAPSYQ